MRLQLKVTNPAAATFYRESFQKQSNATSHPDAGFDLYCPQEVTIQPGETVCVDLGIACEATYKGSPTAFYIYPRSSISKTPLRLANSVGIVDSGYRGNIMIALDNIKHTPYTIQKGQRLAQICSPQLTPISLSIVESLSTTKRGGGGFGSTGR
jgi:dUTP pyrophosphatase